MIYCLEIGECLCWWCGRVMYLKVYELRCLDILKFIDLELKKHIRSAFINSLGRNLLTKGGVGFSQISTRTYFVSFVTSVISRSKISF